MVADEENEVEGNVVGNISLRYHGPALDHDHTMSARTLAPALLSFADAIDAAKDELAPKAKVELRVSATQPGDRSISNSSSQVSETSRHRIRVRGSIG